MILRVRRNFFEITTFPNNWFLHIPRRSLSVRPHNNIRCSLCHRYVTCPRFDRRYPIPSSISLPESLFTRSVIHHLATNSLVAMLARLYVMCITEKALRYLSDNRSDKSSSRNMPTQYVPS